MKLFTKYNRISITVSILVFLVGCLAFYFMLKYVLINQIDKSLKTEQTEITQYAKEHNSLPEIVEAYDQEVSYRLVDQPVHGTQFLSQKIPAKESKRSGSEWVRLLKFGISLGNRNYEVKVSKSQVETEGLLILILVIAAGMTGLIVLISYLVNTFFIKRLWKPFHHSINAVQQYRLSRQDTLELPSSTIYEFDLLNQSINGMARHIHDDYKILKEFAANAAHEMQTPLAVIVSSIDTIIQQERLLQLADEPILTIQRSADKLIRLNQALLLLTRIENKQFRSDEAIRLDLLVEHKYNELKELLNVAEITAEIETVAATINFNKHLAETVLDNLFNNAIRHNIPHGFIRIKLTEQYFSLGNTSNLPPLDPDKVFQRFYRHPETKPAGNGLGLSIVKQVCNLAGYPVAYAYSNGMHVVSIQLNRR